MLTVHKDGGDAVLKIKIGYGKYVTVRMLGSTIKRIWNGSGRYDSRISLPINNSPAVFAVELDLNRYSIGLQGDPSILDDDAFYYVCYSKTPESYGFSYYATISIGHPEAGTLDEYYGVS